MMSMAICCPTTGEYEQAVTSWRDTMTHPWPIHVDDTSEGDDAGFLVKCDKFWRGCDADVIAYFHNDLYALEHGWDERVLREFDDPSVAIVGFVGGTQLGRPDIYRTPYHYTQLARNDVWSNMVDAEAHGRRTHESRNLAVVDSCAVVVRRELLVRTNGWPVDRYPNSSHCSDLWACCVAHRLGCRVRLVPVKCQHKGGGKGTIGAQWADARGTDAVMHQDAHRVLYDEFRDVLPLKVR